MSDLSDDVRSRRGDLSDDVSTRRREALALLDSGARVRDVAAALGVSTRTLSRWRVGHAGPTPAAVHALAVAHAERMSTVSEGLRVAAAEALRSVEVLIEIRDDPDAPPGARIRAAFTLLDLAGIVPGALPVATPTPERPAYDRAALIASLNAQYGGDEVVGEIRAERSRRESEPD